MVTTNLLGGSRDMGKITTVLSFLFICVAANAATQTATSKQFEPSMNGVQIYMQGMTQLEFAHFIKPNVNKEALPFILQFYVERIDTYKIVFSKQDIIDVAKNISEKGDSQAEVNAIYSLYNLYLKKLNDIKPKLANLKPVAANNKSLATKIAKNANALAKQQSDFVYHRYLKAEIAGVSSDNIPATIEALIDNEIRKSMERPELYPIYAFLNEFASHLDSFSYLTSNYQKEDTGGYVGIYFSSSLEGVQLENVVTGGAAEKAGLKKGDQLISYKHKVDSKPINLSVLSLHEFSELVDDLPETTSVYTIQRGGEKKEINLTRAKQMSIAGFVAEKKERDEHVDNSIVQLRYVSKSDSNKRYPVIYIGSFVPTNFMKQKDEDEDLPISSAVLQKVKELEAIWATDKNVDRSITLDLRGNGGGDTNEAIATTEIFVKSKVQIPVVVTNEEGQPLGQIMQISAERSEKFLNKAPNVPIAAWVDQQCASGCELLASVLQDTGRALIVGTDRTFGKGIGQSVSSLVDSSNIDPLDIATSDEDLSIIGNLAVTTFVYFRLDGTTLQLKGIRPDIKLPNGSENKAKLMADVDYPLYANIEVPPQTNLLSKVDSKIVEDLQTRSDERRNRNPYYNLVNMMQLLNFRVLVNNDMSLNLNSLKENYQEMKELEKGVLDNIKGYEAKKFPYALITSKGETVDTGIGIASIQELVSISADYFQAAYQ